MAEKPVAEVHWEDSVGRHGWHEEVIVLPGKENMMSIGYVMQDDEGGIVLLQSFDSDPGSTRPYGCQEAIPRSAIRKVKYLRSK